MTDSEFENPPHQTGNREKIPLRRSPRDSVQNLLKFWNVVAKSCSDSLRPTSVPSNPSSSTASTTSSSTSRRRRRRHQHAYNYCFFYHYYCCQDSVNWCPTHAIETGRDRGGDWDLVTRYALSRVFRFLRPVGPGLAWLANWRPLKLGTRYGSVPGTPRELENDRWPI